MAAKAAKKTEQEQIITIKPIKQVSTEITIVGDTPLLVHAWSEKAKKQMLEAQQKKKVDKKAMAIRDPFAEFMGALYWLTPKPKEDTPEAFEEAIANGAKFGFPLIAIKEAALSAAYRAGIIPNQVAMRCSFFLGNAGEDGRYSGMQMGVIDTDTPPYCQEDMVKIGGMAKTADLRYRPVFDNWKMHVKVTMIDTGIFTMDSIINAINLGGQMNGVGEWRMERSGDFGRFHVE